MTDIKVLFILKKRETYSASVITNLSMSTGLYNSASFNHDLFESLGVQSKMVVVNDNNDIDREVQAYRPTHVILEALWCVPDKFAVLQPLHPKVKWIIRLHSEAPFLANEGIAMDWVADYTTFKNVYIGVNAPRMLREIRQYVATCHSGINVNDKVLYMPNNFTKVEKKAPRLTRSDPYINIACFGAIRPLKNHLIQALAAIEFAEKIGKKLRFHVNASRIEMKGGPVVHNLVGVFSQVADRGHVLVNHAWAPREDFLELCSEMDIGMQVSFTETFNIVAADLISVGVPIVASSEVPWSEWIFNASPTSSEEIVNALTRTYYYPRVNLFCNRHLLNKYTKNVKKVWKKYFEKEGKTNG